MEDRYEIHVNPGFGKKRFSRQELLDIAVSMLVLGVAFAILYRSGTVMDCLRYHLGDTLCWLSLIAICLCLVFFSFLLHELGHKFVAQKYGLWSEFRMYPMGLVLTIVTAFLGFLFAAPGAVYIRGNMSDDTNGKVSIAGPAVNIVLAVAAIAGLVAVHGSMGDVVFLHDMSLLVYVVLMMMASLNAFLALFNLLPVPPLDGSKIIKWNPAVWVAAIAVSALLLAYIYLWAPSVAYYPF